MPHELINHLLDRPKIIGEAAQMLDDEVHVTIFRGEHLDVPGLSADIDQHRQAVRLGSGADLAGRLRPVTMNLETTKSVSPYRLRHHRVYPPCIAGCMDPGRADETRAVGCDQPSQLPVGEAII